MTKRPLLKRTAKGNLPAEPESSAAVEGAPTETPVVDVEAVEPAPEPVEPAPATSPFGSGGVYRSLGGGRRVKLT